MSDLAPDLTWVHCEVKDHRFEGAGGPRELERILRVFLDWARSRSGSRLAP